MRTPSIPRPPIVAAGVALAVGVLTLASPPVRAEPAPAEPAPAEPAVAEPAPAEPVVAEPAPTEPVVAEPAPTEPVVAEPARAEPVVAEPQVGMPVLGGFKLHWHGGAETDIGYARYSFDTPAYPKEQYYDFRGRFVIGPMIERDLGNQTFLRANAELVAWVRETYNVYQINVDDAWLQYGRKGSWDLQIGRFMTWPVYDKGLGFDLYTLDDTGAIETPPYESGLFGPDIYEVSYIFNRETPGRAAFHLFPTDTSGIELVGQYGKEGTSNTIGTRLAGTFSYRFVRLAAGGEYLFLSPAQETTAYGPDGELIRCDTCGHTHRFGLGGSAVVNLKRVQLGASLSQGMQRSYSIKEGTFDKNSSLTTRSVGGYLQLDVGDWLLRRSLILGGGVHRTEVLNRNEDFDRHVQWALYAAYPLGATGALLKLVLSRADLLTEDSTGDFEFVIQSNARMVSGRLRVVYPF